MVVPTTKADLPSGAAKEPSVFLTHGAGGDLNGEGLVALSEGLAGAGHPTVRANLPYRDAGRSSPPAAEKSVPGLVEIFEFVSAGFPHSKSWVAGGRSYGGRVASLAAAEGSLSVTGLLFYSYPLHRPGDPSSPRTDHWPDIRVPCLFLEGTHDPFCDLELLEAHLPRLPVPAKLLVVEGADHGLKVAKSRSTTGQARSEREVIRSLVPEIAQWLALIA